MNEQLPPDFTGIIGAILISWISGFISIAQRIVRGYQASVLWVTSEFCSAILCGYLMYVTYPQLEASLPEWMAMPVMVALAAHIGGRAFQGLENLIYRKYGVDLDGSRQIPKEDE